MINLSDLRLSKNMKYTALYVAMRFHENKLDIFEKAYSNGVRMEINSANQKVRINGTNAFKIDTHESFVMLECIDRILTLGYSTKDFKIQEGECGIVFNGFHIKFIVWNESFNIDNLYNKEVLYKSRLVSGVIEYRTKIIDNEIYDYGLFDKYGVINLRKKITKEYNNPNFIIEENRIIRYIGKSKKVSVPIGIEEIESAAFWDNQYIEEVVLPDTLVNMGGDTFYNCKNLRKINIPRSVKLMGNNPFAGCPIVDIINQSESYVLSEGILYTSDKKALIYCSIQGKIKELEIPEGVMWICKHAFYLCDRLEKITLPSTLERMENNPFSGCSKLQLVNKTNAYYIKDDVIYNKFKTSVVGALNKISSNRLEIMEGIITVNRNSFWNCNDINKIVFPSTLEDIGYNPFVGCSNICFESNSSYYKVEDDILYNKDMTKIICYPSWKAKGIVNLPDSVLELERGAFSGCVNMTGINLHNVNKINKACFTNCTSLKQIYCSDLIDYIGEWAFAHCSSLEEISISKRTIVDNNAFSNSNARIIVREDYSNYLIESDNKFTLQSMRNVYKEKIDSILIDPPYNSNIDYIGYKDGNYEEGYLNFIELRIRLSYDLLSKNGFFVINIDQGEVENLEQICRNIFGKDLVNVYKWKKINPFFDINRKEKKGKKIVMYEYIIICKKTANALLNKIKQPYIEDGVINEKEQELPIMLDCFGTTSSAKDEIKMIFGTREYFSTPKPVKLMKELIRATSNKSSIVMDCFAGSGTVGQACVELNREDGGNRKFILVSNNESNICERVAKRRLDKANVQYVFIR